MVLVFKLPLLDFKLLGQWSGMSLELIGVRHGGAGFHVQAAENHQFWKRKEGKTTSCKSLTLVVHY